MKTRNEKRLLMILGLVVFLMANYFGYKWLAARQASLHLAAAELRADQADAKIDLLETPRWHDREAWVRANQPKLTDEGESKAQVLAYVLKGARDNKLKVVDENLNDVTRGPAGACVNVSVKVNGSLENLCKWLSAFQKPEQFYAVSLFSLKVNSDQKSMDCTLQLARYFREAR